MFWHPPTSFSQWSPSSLVVDDVSYSCAEQFMMAEKAHVFQDRRARELIMSSPDPRAHKRIGRGVRIWATLFGAAFERATSLQARLPSSHRTRL